MKAGIFRTVWIMLLTIIYTVNTCGGAIIKSFRGNMSRTWADEALQLWVARMLRLLKIRCQVFNPYNIKPVPGQPTIVMCNHSSLFDIPLSLYAFPNQSLRMLAKKELANIPIFGSGMNAAEFPTIDRKNRHQAIKDLEKVEHLLKTGIVMWIAPEGTRSKNGKLAPFKKGGFITAIKAKATIIPVGIRGANDILPAKTFQFNLNQSAEVHIGEPIDATNFTLENKDALIEVVFKSIKELCDS